MTVKHTPWATVKERVKNSRLIREFTITLEQYNLILKFQDFKCAICKRPAKDFTQSLAVDHCHKTGLVRGLLCWECNKIVGERAVAYKLINAGNYLLNPPVTAALGKAVYAAPGRVGTKKRAKLLAALKALRLKEKT